MRLALFLVPPLLMLSACGGGGGNSDAPSAPANSVKPVSAPSGTNWIEHVERTPEGGVRMGNPDAPLKLIEFGSRTCPVCGLFDREGYDPLTQNYVATGKLSWEFREYAVHGAPDLAPILLGNCVDTAAFFPLLNGMYQDQERLTANMQQVAGEISANTSLTPVQVATQYAEKMGYLDYVKQRGVPEAKARQCLTDQAALDAISANMQKAQDQYQVSGTPSFILNGTKLDLTSWQALEAALKQAGA